MDFRALGSVWFDVAFALANSTGTSTASSRSYHSLVLGKDVSKTVNLTRDDTSENNIDNFEVHSRVGANQEEASISGGMPILQATSPVNHGPATWSAGVANPTRTPPDPSEDERGEAPYLGIMASLPTLIKKSIRLNLTDDQLDGITSYFSIPHDK
ncbi:hypothetical protein LIER_30808 [Lithospermum erythrorhizon]|uniref:Uncharacterized protein n=1 Tax=Lithospermum erythrorhizon TaxID=34254 RepID=A0AAV3RQX8_LITER